MTNQPGYPGAGGLSPNLLKLGAIPSPNDPRTLRLEDFLTPTGLPEPTHFTNSDKVNPWGMLANDRYGDCVVAGHGHNDMLQSVLAGTPNRPTDQEVIDRYFAETGGPDVGLVILNFLKSLRKNPFEGKKILGYAAVDPRNMSLTRQAIAMFGAVYRGILLPRTAQAQTGAGMWDVPTNPADPNAQPGSWGAHLTLDTGYITGVSGGLETITWGMVQTVSWAFYPRYSMESWVVIPMYPVPGFDQQKFIDALRAIGSQVDVDPVPVPPPVTEPTLRGATDAQFEAELLRRYGDLAGIDINLLFRRGRQWTRGWRD